MRDASSRRSRSCGAALQSTQLPLIASRPCGIVAGGYCEEANRSLSAGPRVAAGRGQGTASCGAVELPPIGPVTTSTSCEVVGGPARDKHLTLPRPPYVCCAPSAITKGAMPRAGVKRCTSSEHPAVVESNLSSSDVAARTGLKPFVGNSNRRNAAPESSGMERRHESDASSKGYRTKKCGSGSLAKYDDLMEAGINKEESRTSSYRNIVSSDDASSKDGVQSSQSSKPSGSTFLEFVSDGLRKVLDEEEVTYSWRRRDAAPAQVPGNVEHASSKVLCNDTSRMSDLNAKGDQFCTRPSSRDANGDSSQLCNETLRSGAPSERTGKLGAESSRLARNTCRPPRPQASLAVVVASGSSRHTFKGKSPMRTPSTVCAVDLKVVAAERAARIASLRCMSPASNVSLITYDGSVPHLKPSMLTESCSCALKSWIEGEISGSLALFYIENWTRGEVMWPQEDAGALQERLGVVAGTLSDVSLQRPSMQELLSKVFERPPVQEIDDATLEVLQRSKLEEGNRLLVSEVEYSLQLSDSCALAESLASRVRSAIRRDLLRMSWARDPPADKGWFCDSWLLKELAKSPQEVTSVAQATSTQQLLNENEHLDRYFIRLLKLKRALLTLIDMWEKVDHYVILGVPSSVSDGELKVAYRKACLRLHPDKGGDKEKFQQLQDSYARILEERAARKPAGDASGHGTNVTSPQADSSSEARRYPSRECKAKSAQKSASTGQPALEGPGSATFTTEEVPAGDATDSVMKAAQMVTEVAAVALRCVADGERADAQVRQLKQDGGGVDALRKAQEAGNLMLQLSGQLGNLGPQLTEAVMEVAERSLALAARFSAVPKSLLLTDVALSCTFEASRIKHAAAQLLEVRKDTESTLQTLQTTLNMASIIGTVDAETFKLSLGLVAKAGKRMIALQKQLSACVMDACQRSAQCSALARAVAAFAAGREVAEAEAASGEPLTGLAALPSYGSAARQSPDATNGPAAASVPPFEPPKCERDPIASVGRASAVRESRLQNDRLLRQLNQDLLGLQKRARKHLSNHRSDILAGVPDDAQCCALKLAVEVLSLASSAVADDLRRSGEPLSVGNLIARHFEFVEICGKDLAVLTDTHGQIIRVAALLDAQVLLGSLVQVKDELLLVGRDVIKADKYDAFSAAVESHFDILSNAVISARMA